MNATNWTETEEEVAGRLGIEFAPLSDWRTFGFMVEKAETLNWYLHWAERSGWKGKIFFRRDILEEETINHCKWLTKAFYGFKCEDSYIKATALAFLDIFKDN